MAIGKELESPLVRSENDTNKKDSNKNSSEKKKEVIDLEINENKKSLLGYDLTKSEFLRSSNSFISKLPVGYYKNIRDSQEIRATMHPDFFSAAFFAMRTKY